MNIFISWIKANPYASTTIFLLVCSTLVSFWQAMSARSQIKVAKSQAETAVRGLVIAERAASAAEQQLADARAATITAQRGREEANQRAKVADEQAKVAHEQMKAALAPQLVMLRIQDQMGLEVFIENQGSGFAGEITWDYIPPIKPTDSGRPNQGFSSNVLAPRAREKFLCTFDRFQQTGIMFRYSSRDGRTFWTHVSISNDGFGRLRHVHLPESDQF